MSALHMCIERKKVEFGNATMGACSVEEKQMFLPFLTKGKPRAPSALREFSWAALCAFSLCAKFGRLAITIVRALPTPSARHFLFAILVTGDHTAWPPDLPCLDWKMF